MSYADYEHWKTTPIAGPPRLSIVVPTYNERERIIPTVGAIASFVSGLGYDWELIVADDGSTDGTADLVDELALANLRVLRAARNGGKGSAVRRGVLAAGGAYVVFIDADNSTPIEQLPTLLHKLTDEGYDLAIGSRATTSDEQGSRPLLRRITSGGLRLIARLLLRLGVRDTQCGFKAYAAPVARRLHSAQTIAGFSFDLEILYLAHKFGYRVAEVPIAFWEAPGSKVRPIREARRFVRDLILINLNDLRGTYANA